MEVIGKLLFLVLLSVGTAYSVIHFVGDDFLSSGLDRNLLEEPSATYEDVDLEEYRQKLRSEYYEYLGQKESGHEDEKQEESRQIWNDTVKRK